MRCGLGSVTNAEHMAHCKGSVSVQTVRGSAKYPAQCRARSRCFFWCGFGHGFWRLALGEAMRNPRQLWEGLLGVTSEHSRCDGLHPGPADAWEVPAWLRGLNGAPVLGLLLRRWPQRWALRLRGVGFRDCQEPPPFSPRSSQPPVRPGACPAEQARQDHLSRLFLGTNPSRPAWRALVLALDAPHLGKSFRFRPVATLGCPDPGFPDFPRRGAGQLGPWAPELSSWAHLRQHRLGDLI